MMDFPFVSCCVGSKGSDALTRLRADMPQSIADGERKGTHAMKKLKIGGAVAAVCLALSSWASSLEVTDVKIAQRYPWNGLVDITYTVKSDDADAEVFVYPIGYDADKATKVALNPQYLSGEGVNGGVRPGTRRMTWDMASQMGKDYNRAAFSVSFIAYCDAKPYMVVDLSEGSSAKDYPISYLSSIPDGGWTDEYKTTKMLFRLIPPGQIDGATSITKPFYFAVWPMTTQQYALIMGGTGTSETKTGLSYNDIRGSVLGSKYPEHQQVDADSIVGKLRLRTGVTFDLSTQWQWKYAALALTPTLNKTCNAWGICNCGDYCEWCINGLMIGRYYYYDNSILGSAYTDWRYYQKVAYSTEAKSAYEAVREDATYHKTHSQYLISYSSSYTGFSSFKTGSDVICGEEAQSRPVCRLVALPNCK